MEVMAVPMIQAAEAQETALDLDLPELVGQAGNQVTGFVAGLIAMNITLRAAWNVSGAKLQESQLHPDRDM